MVLRQFPLALRGVVLVQRQHLVLEENGLFVGEEASEELEVGGGEIAHADMADVQVVFLGVPILLGLAGVKMVEPPLSALLGSPEVHSL